MQKIWYHTRMRKKYNYTHYIIDDEGCYWPVPFGEIFAESIFSSSDNEVVVADFSHLRGRARKKYSASLEKIKDCVIRRSRVTQYDLRIYEKYKSHYDLNEYGHEREYYDTRFQRDFTDEAPDIVGWPFVLVSLAIKNGRKKFLRRRNRKPTA